MIKSVCFVSFLHLPGHGFEKYDFSLERRSVQWGLELANAEKKAAMLEAEARDCSDQAQDNDGGGENTTMPATDNQDPPPPALNPVLVGLSHNAILTPLPAPSLGPRKTQPSTTHLHNLNLADFEREEDPFDKLELKTLDDKEELRNILQSQPQPQPPSSVSESGSRANSPSPPSAITSHQSKTGFSHKPNGLVDLLNMDRVGHPGRAGLEVDDRPCNIRSLTFPKLSDSGDPEPLRYSKLPVPIPAFSENLSNGGPPTIPKTHVIIASESQSLIRSDTQKPVNTSHIHF